MMEVLTLPDQSDGLAAQIPDLPNLERRSWNLREVSMMLTLAADTDRVAQRKALASSCRTRRGHRSATTQPQQPSSTSAAVRNWAAALDRGAYETSRHDDGLLIQQATDPEVEQVLGATMRPSAAPTTRSA